MNDNQSQNEIIHELRYGNGHSTEETVGMTLRELVLEIRQDVKEVKDDFGNHKHSIHPTAMSYKQFGVAMIAYSTILLSLHGLIVDLTGKL